MKGPKRPGPRSNKRRPPSDAVLDDARPDPRRNSRDAEEGSRERPVEKSERTARDTV